MFLGGKAFDGVTKDTDAKGKTVMQAFDYKPDPIFVISIGFSLGGRDHRGQNILRVF